MTKYISLAALFLLACGPSASSGGGADGSVTTDTCNPGETRCVGQGYQTCESGFYVEQESCAGGLVCAPDLGCVACRPNSGRACSGDEVRTCNADGSFGDLIETCEFEQCRNGNCGGGDDCAAGADLVYTVDDANVLYSFDPRKLPGEAFAVIGTLNCPNPGISLQAGGGAATPFSMSVDRSATAWVLFSSGKMFKVSTVDASCQATSFAVGQNGFELFGMGFVSNSPGSSDETLFISGGTAGNQAMGGNLGTIDTTSLTVTRIGALTSNGAFQPELTGTGDAELFGYYPGQTSTFVANINKASAGNDQTWPLPNLTDAPRAWAFAHWGGEFYIFITTIDALDPFASPDARVLKLNPDTSAVDNPLPANRGKIIVGAGVSTCAPVVVN